MLKKYFNKITVLTLIAIVFLSFTFTYNGITGKVAHDSDGCCLLTCTDTLEGECPEQYFTQGSCFDKEECNIGCCIDGEGYCYTNYLKNSCDNEGKFFVGGRECAEYKQCMVAPPWPADQEGYMYTNDANLLALQSFPTSGKKGTIFKFEATTMDPADVKINISTDTYEEVFTMNDDGENDDFPNDEIYTYFWDSNNHGNIFNFKTVKFQAIIDGTAIGTPNELFLSPTDCIPSSFIFNQSEERTNVIFARKPNLDYMDIESRSQGIFSEFIRNYSMSVLDYEMYYIETPVDNANGLNSRCRIDDSTIILLDSEEDFCRKEDNVYYVSNSFRRKDEAEIYDDSWTEDFCSYIETPVQMQRDILDKFIPPSVQILNIENNSEITTEYFDLIFNATDNRSERLRYDVYFNHDNNKIDWGYMDVNTTLTLNIPVEDGNNELYIIVTDLDGNYNFDRRIISANISNFVVDSSLEEEMVSIKEFSFNVKASHDRFQNLSYVVFDKNRAVQLGKLQSGIIKPIKVNLTPGYHEVYAVVYDTDGRTATTLSSEVQVVNTETLNPAHLNIDFSFTGLENLIFEKIYPELPIRDTTQKCTVNQNLSDLICINEIILNPSSLQIELFYDFEGEIQGNLEASVNNNDYTKQIIFENKTGEIVISINEPSLASITGGAVVLPDGSTVDEETGQSDTGATHQTTDDGGVIGPDGFVYYPVDAADSYEPQKLCGGGDTGRRYRPSQCIDSFTTNIDFVTGARSFDGYNYHYEYDYEIEACNENVFVDVFLKNNFLSGLGTERKQTKTLDVRNSIYTTRTFCRQGYLHEYKVGEIRICVNRDVEPYIKIRDKCSQFFKEKGVLADGNSLCVHRDVEDIIEFGSCPSGYSSAGLGICTLNDEITREVSVLSFYGKDILTEVVESARLETGYKLIDNNVYKTPLEFRELCVVVSDDDVVNQPVCFPFSLSQCSNGRDDDGDGLIDMDDPGCSDEFDNDESDATSECQDGIDNDGDGLTDMEDPACVTPQHNNEYSATSQCQDGIDNDGDGLIDMNDPGCEDFLDNNEGDGTTECQDGMDNDNDGFIDEEDPGCHDSLDCYPDCYNPLNSEEAPIPACYLTSDTDVRTPDVTRSYIQDNFIYDIYYEVHACKRRIAHEVYLMRDDLRYNLDVNPIINKGDSESKSESVSLPTNYTNVCIYVDDTTVGDLGLSCWEI